MKYYITVSANKREANISTKYNLIEQLIKLNKNMNVILVIIITINAKQIKVFKPHNSVEMLTVHIQYNKISNIFSVFKKYWP